MRRQFEKQDSQFLDLVLLTNFYLQNEYKLVMY
jgi:hypothetical protein